jgi:hypothetical protein
MKDKNSPINVTTYDRVAKLLIANPKKSHVEIAQRAKVSLRTVVKVWDGTISRPTAIVSHRLTQPQRCPQCGARCIAWPCMTCEMVYKTESLKRLRRASAPTNSMPSDHKVNPGVATNSAL